ncbi:hypothetical protein BDD12DRAFT_914435 [Trichophaea hybrida]|nr:hypothetical protein BDD12DRAFT_914435 [Trichophaea hybrida]
MRFPLCFPLVVLFASIAASQLIGALIGADVLIPSLFSLNEAQASTVSSILAKETATSYNSDSELQALQLEVASLYEQFTKTNTWYFIVATMTARPAASKAVQSVLRHVMKDDYDLVEKVMETQTYLTGSAKESMMSDFEAEKKVVDEAIQQGDNGNSAERVVNSRLAVVIVAVVVAVMVL